MQTNDIPLEMLGIAMTMEQSSARFYRELAAQSGNARVRQFCMKLAMDEGRHYSIYQEMQMEWAATYRSAPLKGDEFAALKALAQSISPDPGDVAARVKTLGEHGALIAAIEREKQAIEFYERLLGVFPQHAELINQIIREEDGHAEHLEDLAAAVSKPFDDAHRLP